MSSAVTRFAGHADGYDRARPQPPAELPRLLMQWAGVTRPDVTDVGAGTGLSTAVWAGVAATVTAVEPGAQMRAAARRRLGLPATLGDTGSGEINGTLVTLAAGTAEATGRPAASADIVTASQAMHWFDTGRALPEIARLLRPGGVFAAYDCDWPPCVDAPTDAAYAAFEAQARTLEAARELEPPRAAKDQHLAALRASGRFQFATEVCLHHQEQGDAGRLIALALSQGGVQALLAAGASEDQLGLTRLREVAAVTLPRPRTWWWTYRVRMGVTPR